MTGNPPFDEAALCRLFLRAMNGTYVGYKAPRPDESTVFEDENSLPTETLSDVVERLLSLNPRTRLKPR